MHVKNDTYVAWAQDEALDMINLECGTSYEVTTPWHAIFAEEEPAEAEVAAGAAGGVEATGVSGGLLGADWPEDDESDSDFE